MNRILAGCIPFAGVLCAFSTVAYCYKLTSAGGRIPPGVTFPAISALGVQLPEKRAYQIGFFATSVLVAVNVYLFKQIAVPALLAGYSPPVEAKPDEVEKFAMALAKAEVSAADCIKFGWWMTLGIGLQGLFTLEMSVSSQSMVHWGGAMLFMYGAMNHCQLSVELFGAALEGDFSSPRFLPNANIIGSVLKLKKFCLTAPSLMLILPLLLQAFQANNADGTQQGTAEVAITSELSALQINKFNEMPIAEIKKLLVEAGAQESDFSSKLEKADLVSILVSKINLKLASKHGADAKPANLERMPPKVENSMGLMQWGLIFSFVIFLGSYGLDFMLITE